MFTVFSLGHQLFVLCISHITYSTQNTSLFAISINCVCQSIFDLCLIYGIPHSGHLCDNIYSIKSTFPKMDLQKISLKNYNFCNWSRTFSCKPDTYFIPETIDEIREILYLAKSEHKHIRVVGCGASPSDICLSTDFMLSLKNFNHVLHLDKQDAIITVQGGIKLCELNRFLENNDLALPILGSLSDSTLAGVISVGTHGTGFATGIIADYVLELRMIIPSGDIIICSRNAQSELFLSALCGLGALGIILEVTLQCEPKFYLHQLTYPSSLDNLLDCLDEMVESCDHFRFLWFPHTNYVSVSVANKIGGNFLQFFDIDYNSRRKLDNSNAMLPFRLTSEKAWFQKVFDWILNYGLGYHALQFAYWVSTYIPAIVPHINRICFWLLYSNNNVQLDISYKIFNFECLFDQYVNEWCIPRSKTASVLRELRNTIEQSASSPSPIYAHFPIEVRFARASDIYLSPTHGRDSTYINIICYRPYHKFVEHQAYWDIYENIVKRVGGRPHWAKQHRETMSDFVRMYPYFRAWTQVRRRLDPLLLFSNSYMDRIFNSDKLNQSKSHLFARKNFDVNVSLPSSISPTGMIDTKKKSIEQQQEQKPQLENGKVTTESIITDFGDSANDMTTLS